MHLLKIDQKRDWYFRNTILSSNNIPAKKRSKFFPCKDLAPFCFLSKGRLFWKTNFAKLEKFSESKSLLLWIARIRGRPLDFLNTCPLQVYFCIISWLQTCYLNKRLQNECIAEKNWRSKVELLDVCFLQKMLSRPKDRSFTPPENLPGEGLKHTFIREKWRFSAVRKMGRWAQIYPQNEKTDQKTGRRRILKMVGGTWLEHVTSAVWKQRSNQLS